MKPAVTALVVVNATILMVLALASLDSLEPGASTRPLLSKRFLRSQDDLYIQSSLMRFILISEIYLTMHISSINS